MILNEFSECIMMSFEKQPKPPNKVSNIVLAVLILDIMSLSNIPQVEIPKNFDVFLKRTEGISRYSGLGPADLVQVDWVSPSFGLATDKAETPTNSTVFHLFGVDCSSPSTISAFISTLLSHQRANSTPFEFSQRVKKITFCVFDPFNSVDVHLEFGFPGKTIIRGIDDNQEESNEISWNAVFVASALRSLKFKGPSNAGIFNETLQTRSDWEKFLGVSSDLAIELSKSVEEESEGSEEESVGNESELEEDSEAVKVLLEEICFRMSERKLNALGMKFFVNLAKEIPEHMCYLIKFLRLSGLPCELLLFNSLFSQAKMTPKLLLEESRLLIRSQKLKEAETLLKSVLETQPSLFDAWILVSEVLLRTGKFAEAICSLNAFPFFIKSPFEITEGDDILTLEISKLNVKIPKSPPLLSTNKEYCMEPVQTDLEFEEERAGMRKLCFEERLLKAYKKLPGSRIPKELQKAYGTLVKIEREIGWDLLLKIRSSIFDQEEDQKPKKKKKKLKKSKPNPSQAPLGKNPRVEEEEKNSSRTREEKRSIIQEDGARVEMGTGLRRQTSKTHRKSKEKNQNEGFSSRSPKHQLAISNSFELDELPLNEDKITKEKHEEAPGVAPFFSASQEHFPKKNEEESTPSTGCQQITRKPNNCESFEGNSSFNDFLDQSKLALFSLGGNHSMSYFDEKLSTIESDFHFPKKTKSIREISKREKKAKEMLEEVPEMKKEETIDLSKQQQREMSVQLEIERELKSLKKRICSKELDDLFECLFQDLNAFMDLMPSEERKKHNEAAAINSERVGLLYGYVWLERGKLCDRLRRMAIAEECYLVAMGSDDNNFAIKRLIEINVAAKNTKKTMKLARVFLENFQQKGFNELSFLPQWLRNQLLQVLEDTGSEEFLAALSEAKMLQYSAVLQLINHNAYWNSVSSPNEFSSKESLN